MPEGAANWKTWGILKRYFFLWEVPMPQIVPVSDFRADVKSVSKYTDRGKVVVLTQNGRPRWAMVDYDERNASAHE